MYLFPQNKPREATYSGQQLQPRELMRPTTSAVNTAYAAEALSGVGTEASYVAAGYVVGAESKGSPLTRDQYEKSENYRANIPWYPEITDAAASELAKFHDTSSKRQEIIADATAGQTALGLTTAFGVGVFEPANMATGLATSLVLTPIAGSLAPAAGSLRRLMKMRQLQGQYSGRIALGAVEGGVSAAIMEPSNRYSAGILKQDYTMADSAWNIALSTAFGVTASAAGIGAKEIPRFMREKFERNGAKAPEIISMEMDTAVNQLAQGKKVDVSLVERSVAPERAQAFRPQVIKDIINEGGNPVYHDSSANGIIGIMDSGAIQPNAATGIDKSVRTDTSVYVTRNFDNYSRKADSPYRLVIDQRKVGHKSKPTSSDNRASGINEFEEVYNKPVPREAISALAINESNPAIQKDIESGKYTEVLAAAERAGIKIQKYKERGSDFNINEHATDLQKYAVDDLNDNNDTAIDARAVAELDAYEEKLALEKDVAALEEYNAYMKEIAAMKNDGQISEADFTELKDTLASVNEADLNKAYEAAYSCLTRG